MALRKPLVLNSGQIQQLQSGDTLDAPQSGGDVIVLTNDDVGANVIGSPVYIDAADGFKAARANASGTTKVAGLVAAASIASAASGNVMVGGVLTATTGQWDTAFGTSGGLTPGTTYYLSDATAGKGTPTAPSTSGSYIVRLGVALSTTELMVKIESPILL
jgi:hypothetical protein